MKKILLILTQLMFAMGLSAQTQQELRDSLSMIEGLIEQHPKAVRLYMRKAALHIDLDQWGKALDDYDAALAIMPYNLTALYYRGYVNHHLKRYAFARKDYETVLLVEPHDKHALMGLIHTDMADRRETYAYDNANRLVEFYPDEAEAYAVRCEVEQALGMDGAALDDICKAISLEKVDAEKKYPFDADSDIVQYNLIAFDIYLAKGRAGEARKCLDYLVDNGLSRMQLADYYARLKK